MLPAEWEENLIPKPGYVFVERDEVEETTSSGRLYIPDTVRRQKKKATATVVKVGAGVSEVEPGDRVVLSAGVGRRLEFGERRERVIFALSTTQMLGRLTREADVDDKGQRAIEGRFKIHQEREHDGQVEDVGGLVRR